METYTQVQYINNTTGYFPELSDKIIHGFSWGKNAGNMRVFDGNEVQARVNTQKFLTQLGLGSIREVIVMNEEHNDRIVVVNSEYYQKIKPTKFGKVIHSHTNTLMK